MWRSPKKKKKKKTEKRNRKGKGFGSPTLVVTVTPPPPPTPLLLHLPLMQWDILSTRVRVCFWRFSRLLILPGERVLRWDPSMEGPCSIPGGEHSRHFNGTFVLKVQNRIIYIYIFIFLEISNINWLIIFGPINRLFFLLCAQNGPPWAQSRFESPPPF